MAKHRRRQARPRGGVVGPALRPVAWSAVFGAALATAVGSPAYAEPVRPYTVPGAPSQVPDGGSRPAPAGTLQLPGGRSVTATTTVPVANTLPAQIEAKRVAIALAGEQLLRIREEQEQVKTQVTLAEDRLRQAQEALTRAKQEADTAATEALKDAAALPPGTYGSELHGLGALFRLQRGEPVSQQAAARQLAVAEEAHSVADTEHAAAMSRAQALTTQHTTVTETRQRDEAALKKLQEQDTGQLAAYERGREAADQRIGAGFIDSASTAGKSADRRALAALKYALAQLGDPYVWAAEGPDQFDCSGLMYAAYRTHAAEPYPLPRVAADQFYATRQRQVDRTALLPGDLIFFSHTSSWTGIHHVAMYIGGGKMVHAPNSNEVVKVETVWWSHFWAATRVFGAVTGPAAPVPTPGAAPGAAAPKPPATTPTTPTPPTTPQPQPQPGTPPTPTQPSPTPSPSRPSMPPPWPTDPLPTQSPSPSPSPSESVSAAVTESPSPSPSPSPPEAAATGTESAAASTEGSPGSGG